MYNDNHSKFAVVIDRRKSLPQILNALCHVALGFAAEASAAEIATMEFLRYRNANGTFSGLISRFPNIVLQTDRGGQLRQFYATCKSAGLRCHGFITTMLGASAAAQQDDTTGAQFDELDFVLVMAFAPATQLDPLTKRFSCWRQPADAALMAQFTTRHDTADGALEREMARELAQATPFASDDILP
jgi:hypothetical protein